MGMIEKVARGIAGGQEDDDRWMWYRQSAIDAIRAMREPTQEMVTGMIDAQNKFTATQSRNWTDEDAMFAAIFSGGVDAALSRCPTDEGLKMSDDGFCEDCDGDGYTE